MRELITNDPATCVGCNRCIRVCPAEGANIAFSEDGKIKVKVDGNRCIACGACISACRHDSRDYRDDTDRFLSDLRAGVPISMFAAPANRANGENWGRLLTWLRKSGVRKIYDVSLGADICTWAHIRYIQRENPVSLITQPCPAIVNYVLMYNHDLLPYLSPIHSPMLCTAIYMKKYEGINDKLAALSPCIAKSHEFEAAHYSEYNVTLKKLYEYIRRNGITLPREESGFDHEESALGRLYSMPGGLKENVELYLGKTLRIDKSEGQNIVYHALKKFSEQRPEHLPAVFDVLNCPEGCNLGTGCAHERDMFEINSIMDDMRQDVLGRQDETDFNTPAEDYDRTLRLNDFIRRYTPQNSLSYNASAEQIEQAFKKLGKETETERKFDCSACGADSCSEMAKKIVFGLNIPENCIQKMRDDIRNEHGAVLDLSSANLANITEILKDISIVKGLSDNIIRSVDGVNDAIGKYNKMANEIDSIAMHINIISLNASIEAARAGQHGKSFAVVAEEIRSLAKTSENTVSETEEVEKQAKSAITEINTMVGRISSEVEKALLNISAISEKTREALVNSE